MATCEECGKYENLPYQCDRCGNTFCSEHRLPENHNCPGLSEWNDPAGVFDSGFDDSVDDTDRTIGDDPGVIGRAKRRIERETSTGGSLGYFRNNVAYALLGALWVVFVLQLIVLAAFGRDAFIALFILSTANPEYVWTWVTSVFSHSGFYHIAANSIVLFFFGPLAERFMGSKKFLGFFVISGAVAGLGHVLTAVALGNDVSVLGASGATFAILGVLTVLRPNMEILLFFVLPMKLKVLTYGIAAISVIFVLSPETAAAAGMGGIAHLAHLIGFAIGLAYGKRLEGNVNAGPGSGVPGATIGGRRGPGGPGGPGGRF